MGCRTDGQDPFAGGRYSWAWPFISRICSTVWPVRSGGFFGDSLPAGEAVQGVIFLRSVGSIALYRAASDQSILAIGNNAVREQLMQQIDSVSYVWATVVHPLSIVSPSAALGASSAVIAGAIVATEVRLGVPFLKCGAVVDHHSSVEDFRHLGINASMAGCTVLGCGAWIQIGASLGYGVKLAVGKILSLENCRERGQTS
jgi:UDP-3-O-[3-hydroxymyristoyl] glucosamine N-acyltransferase